MSITRLTRTIISDQLDRNSIAPSRALGQNFLCDPSMVDKIIRVSEVSAGDNVIEIGPGLGSLTLALAEAGANVAAIELDRHVIGLLEENLETAGLSDQVSIHNLDATTCDWDALIGENQFRVIANLPYNIATPLILDLLATQPNLTDWLVMTQKEAGDRLAAGPGSKTFGVPSIIASYWGDVSIAGTVPPNVFLPKPRVDSTLVKIKRKEPKLTAAEYSEFRNLVRSAFQKRRKMLRGSLSGLASPEQLEAVGIDGTSRPEVIGTQSWIELAKVVTAAGSKN